MQLHLISFASNKNLQHCSAIIIRGQNSDMLIVYLRS